MMDLFGIHLAHTTAFWLLPVFACAFFFIILHHKVVTRGISRLVAQVHQAVLFPRLSLSRRRCKTVFLLLGLAFIFIAFLQPQWGKKERIVQQEGRDVLVVLDISRSMLAADMRPNRLEFIKLKIRSLLQRLKAERVGLILFSGSAFAQCPLTIDHDAFLLFLDQVDVETIASGTTAIDKALLKAIEVFNRSEGRKNKIVILATDGEDFSLQLQQVKRKAKNENIKLFALGIGSTEGAPIPIIDAYGKQIGHEKERTGAVALSKLNEPLLQSLCTELDGKYVKTTYADTDIEEIEQSVKQFEKEKFADKKMSLYEDHYPWVLGLALLLLILEWIL